MNKKILKLVLLCFLFTLNLKAQTADFYYTFNNKKINLIKISGKYLAEFPNGLVLSNTMRTSTPGVKLSDKTFIVTETDSLSSYNSAYNLTPTYLTADGQELYYTREILLKFKNTTSTLSKASLITSKNLTLIKTTPSYEMYQVNGDALQISKSIYVTGQVEFCTPNFIAKVITFDHIPNDPYFNNQWYLHNTGQGTNDGKSTTVDADIDAPEAWDITKGSPNVIVAIIDQGVTSNHPDLPNTRQVRLNGSNFAYQYDGTNDPNDPSPTVSTTSRNNHGNACAGIVAATQDNGEGITGIAPLCKIMPIKIPLVGSFPANVFADAIDFAVANNADIISNSWGYGNQDPNFQPVIVSAITNAIANNKLVVFSAGNTADRVNGENGFVTFPANADIEDLITVGASDRNNNQANYSPNNNPYLSAYASSIEIVAPSNSAYNNQVTGESLNIWTMDIPGENYGENSWRETDYGLPLMGELLPDSGINYNSYTGRMGGTSAAAPQIAGVLALMKSVNPCYSVSQLKKILQTTADKIGGFDYNWNPDFIPGSSIEVGYGKVNAYKAVHMAQLLNTSSFDLMIKDSAVDNGAEPNIVTPYMWTSEDIWVRNQPDGMWYHEHQNPVYNAQGTPNYVYVRVTNKSCFPANGYELLNLYWAKAATSLAWPQNWNGSLTVFNPNLPPAQQNVLLGKKIKSIQLPYIAAGEEFIWEFEWKVPNPLDYSIINTEPWHFCLLARIEANLDPIHTPEVENLNINVKNNNNIAWKNVTVINPIPNPVSGGGDVGSEIGGVIAVGNPYHEPHTFYLELVKEELESGKPIFEEAEVGIKMDDILYKAWERGGKIAQEVNATTDEKKKIVKGNNVILDNIAFNGDETGTLNLTFNFLTKELTEKSKFVYHVIQKDNETGEIIGGETYVIKKQVRPPFIADAGGDIVINKNDIITISATQINEAAIYNWYDADGKLVFTGKDLTIATEIATKYKLEVIATIDGFKDYTEVNVNFKPNTLEVIAPNPASNTANISYKLNDVNSAYLMVLGSYGTSGTTNNYILDVNSSNTNIDLTNYHNGFYTVALVCNGQIVDAKTLVKQ